MSEYGDGDYCSVFEASWRVARKEHRCCACHETIGAGQRYHYTFSVFEDRPDWNKRCERCQIIFEHLQSRILTDGDVDEFCNGELNCGHEYEERWNEPPPEWLAALAFWRPGDPLPEMPRKA